VENCQLGVFLAYTAGKNRALIDRELYLPKSWIADRQRCRQARIPEETEFATKATLARGMIERALAAGVPARWVTADEAYGQDSKFRTWLESHSIGYVVAVPRNQTIPAVAGSSRADHLATSAPEQAWKRRSASQGAKGDRLYDWAVAELPVYDDTTPPGWQRHLLVRRQITSGDIEPELAYYLCFAPTGTIDDELIRVAGARWAIEECFQTAKNEVGLDHYQVRRYDAWYRHITLAMLAAAFLAVTAATAPKALTAGSSRSPSPKSGVCWHT
jgi:SRSO17 transposase